METLIVDFIEQIRLAAAALAEFGSHLFDPTIRLGVTGLSNAGKTVFITALVHGLLRGGRFPVFEAMATGRIARAYLAPQPDYAVPRFDYESHLDALVDKRQWPASTRQISELRIVIDYQSQRGHQRALTLDVVDYPGEWLLDLPLLDKSYGGVRPRASNSPGSGRVLAWPRIGIPIWRRSIRKAPRTSRPR